MPTFVVPEALKEQMDKMREFLRQQQAKAAAGAESTSSSSGGR